MDALTPEIIVGISMLTILLIGVLWMAWKLDEEELE